MECSTLPIINSVAAYTGTIWWCLCSSFHYTIEWILRRSPTWPLVCPCLISLFFSSWIRLSCCLILNTIYYPWTLLSLPLVALQSKVIWKMIKAHIYLYLLTSPLTSYNLYLFLFRIPNSMTIQIVKVDYIFLS